MTTELDIDDVCAGHPKALEELRRLRDLLDRQRWVPVGKELPDRYCYVLVWMPFTDYPITIAERFDDGWRDPAQPDLDCAPSHWMPLPEPPEGE